MKENENKILEGKALITVRRTRLDKVLEDYSEEETILVRKFETDPAYIGGSMGITKNMGNFEFIRLDITAKIPCYVEEIDNVEQQVAGWMDNKMDKKLSELGRANKVV